MCCYCHVLSTTKPSIFFFPFIWTLFFSFVPHFQLGTLVIRLGITSLSKRRLPHAVKGSLTPAQSPTPKHYAWSQNPMCSKRFGCFFFHWCNHNWNQKRKNPLTSPQGPCLILYSLWICVQDFFYYLPACDSLVVAGRWQRHHIADVSFKKLAPLLADRAHVKISYIHHCHLCALCWKLL